VRDERDDARRKLRAAKQQSGTAQDTVTHLLGFRQHVCELAMNGEEGDWGELRWVPPTTDAGWRKFVRYMIDRMVVGGKGDKLTVRFEGVLVVPSLDDAATLEIIENSSSRTREPYDSFAYTYTITTRDTDV